jgi:hypothetical protein
MGMAINPHGIPMTMEIRDVMAQIMVAVFAPTPAASRGRRKAG